MVPMHEEAPLGNPVRLIIELIRHHLIEIFQLLILKDLRVEPCDPVYRIPSHNGKVGHLHLPVP